MRVNRQPQAPVALPYEKSRYAFGERGWAPGPVGTGFVEIPLPPQRPKTGPSSPQQVAIQTMLNLFVKAENDNVPSDLVLKVKRSP